MHTCIRERIALFLLFVITFISFNSAAQTNKFNVDSINALVGKLSSDTDKVETYIDKAQAMNCDDSTSKIAIVMEAKKLAERADWLHGIYKANRMLGQVYLDCQKNYIKSFTFFEDNVLLAQKYGDSINEVVSLETIAKFHQQIAEYPEALAYYFKVLDLKPNIDYQMGVLGEIGLVYSTIGDNALALTYSDSSLSLLSSKSTHDHGDTLQEAALLFNIGDIYFATMQPNKAYEKYVKVEQIGVRLNNMFYQINGLTGIGRTFRMKNDYKSAIANYTNALEKCDSINDFKGEVRVLNELASAYLETYDFKQALAFADSSILLGENQNYINLLSKSYTTLGNIYIRQNKYARAIPSLQKSLGIAQQTGELDDMQDALFALSNAYKKNGQASEALAAYENYISIRDSINNIAKQNAFLRKDLENDFKNIQFADSVKHAMVYEKNIEKQKKYTYSGFIALLLVLLLAFFIYRNYSIQKKYNNLLSKEKMGHLARIEAQSNVLSDIAHIQAHQVRGPVATILGLVSLFNFEDPADPVNKEIIEGLTVVTEKLDNVVKEVIVKENKLRYGKSSD